MSEYLFIIILVIIILIINIKPIEYFKIKNIPIYVINIKRNQDRWLDIRKQDILLNLKLKRFLGVDGRKHKFNRFETNLFNNSYYQSKNINQSKNSTGDYDSIVQNYLSGKSNTLRTNPSTLTLFSEKGCALSHYYLWKKIVLQRIAKCVVCEDDVIFKPQFQNYFHQLKTLDYDIIYLYYSKKINNILNSKNIVKIKAKKWLHAGNVCYLITYKGAYKLLEIIHMKGIYLPIDWLILDNYQYLNIGLADQIYISMNHQLESSID